MPPDPPGSEAALRRLHASGAAECPGVALPAAAFTGRVLELAFRRLARLGAAPSGEQLAAILDRMHAGDLYLAIACDGGIEGAWELLIQRHAPRLEALGIKLGLSRSAARDLAASLPGELIAGGGPAPGRTKLSAYDGTGPLSVWLSVFLRWRVLDRFRAPAPESLEEGGEPLGAPPSPRNATAEDPASLAASEEQGARLCAALERAWQELTPKEALALDGKYRAGLPQAEIARLLAVGEPRVSRILAHALEKLRAAVGGAFGGAGPASEEWPALWRALEGFLVRHRQLQGLSDVVSTQEPSPHGPAPRA